MQLKVLGQYKDPVLFGGFMVSQTRRTPSWPPTRVAGRPGSATSPASTPPPAAVKNSLQAFPTAKVQTNQEYEQASRTC